MMVPHHSIEISYCFRIVYQLCQLRTVNSQLNTFILNHCYRDISHTRTDNPV